MSYAGPRFRQGIKLTSRGSNSLLLRQCSYGARPLSTILSSNHRPCLVQVSITSRNFSLWPSSKTTPTSTPSPPPPLGDSAEKAEILSETPPVEPTSNATTADASPTIAEPSFAPEPATILDSGTIVSDALHNIPGPLQYGDFAALGLSGWMPAGFIRWSFEVINVASGLPWFWTIVAGTAFWRFVCVPLTIKAARTAAVMQPHRKEMAAMQERVTQASKSRNPAALAKANREMKEFYQNLGVSPFGGLVGFLQLPITFGLFFAVKGICDLPVEQLKYSGLDMFPDLTVTDPTLMLPLAMTVAVNAQLLFGARDVAPNMRPMMYFFHFLTIPGYFIIKGLPVGLIISLITTGVLTTTQTLVMRIPRVRRALRMPAYVPPPDTGRSVLAELRTLLSKDGDVKVKVARARREATRKRGVQEVIPKGPR